MYNFTLAHESMQPRLRLGVLFFSHFVWFTKLFVLASLFSSRVHVGCIRQDGPFFQVSCFMLSCCSVVMQPRLEAASQIYHCCMLNGMLETGCFGFSVSLACFSRASASFWLMSVLFPVPVKEERQDDELVSRGLWESTDDRVLLAFASMMDGSVCFGERLIECTAQKGK